MSDITRSTYSFVREEKRAGSTAGAGRSISKGAMTGTGDQTGEIKKLTTLVEISQTLSGALNLKPALHRVLEILERHHGMVRSAITLLNENSGELHIEAANGHSAGGRGVRYRLGEGITGRV